jgi:DNA-binding IclR family transcriptional regulator
VLVLRALGAHPAGLTTASAAVAAGLPRPTTARLLATLGDAGLADRLSDGRWVLGYQLARLGRSADPYATIVERAAGPLDHLAGVTGETAVLARLADDPDECEVLSQTGTDALIGITNWVGRRFPAHASVAGKLALARLPEDAGARYAADHRLERLAGRTITDATAFAAHVRTVRRRGWADSVDELADGLASLGVLVPGADDLSVGISGPTARLRAARRRQLLPAIRKCAAAVGRRLG